jgi:hypothetical protein
LPSEDRATDHLTAGTHYMAFDTRWQLHYSLGGFVCPHTACPSNTQNKSKKQKQKQKRKQKRKQKQKQKQKQQQQKSKQQLLSITNRDIIGERLDEVR